MKYNFRPQSLVLLFAVLIVVTLIARAIVHQKWGYDELGAVTSFLELDDPLFVAEYQRYLQAVGIFNVELQNLFIKLVLPIIVVPIRWTYALGVSPWLGIARWLPINWPTLKPVLMLPYIALAALGLWLALKALSKRAISPTSSLLFLAFTASSAPMFWWTVSLSSYSHHIFCFGILLYASVLEHAKQDNKYFGRRGILIAITPIFNYQYVPVVGMLGLLDFFRGPRIFFAEGRYRTWLLPFVVCTTSAAFLYLRSHVSGKHGSPTTAALTSEAAQLFNFPLQATNLTAAVQTAASRYLDIAYSFFVADSSQFTVLEPIAATTLILCLAFFLIYTLKRADHYLVAILISMLLGTVVLHLVGIMPMSPSRHQLVLYLPLCLLFALGIEQAISSWLSLQALSVFAFLLTITSLAWQADPVINPPSSIPLQALQNSLIAERVDRLVLLPCDFELLLYPKLRQTYSPLYRCGPKLVHTLPDQVVRVGVFSMRPLNEEMVRITLSDYGNFDWSVSAVPFDTVSVQRSGGSLYIAERTLQKY